MADKDGQTYGGHLVDGVVFTTLELVLGTARGVEFVRKLDGMTGFLELFPRKLPLLEEEKERCIVKNDEHRLRARKGEVAEYRRIWVGGTAAFVLGVLLGTYVTNRRGTK